MKRLVAGVVVTAFAVVVPMQLAGAQQSAPAPHDDTLRVAGNGFRYYVDPAPERPTTTNARTSRATALYPLANTFKLHSLASSSRKIYLDFNGYTLPTNSAWVTGAGVTSGPVSGYSLDGSAGFSTAEQTQIQEIWRIVAEKYAPFNVDVTTQDPGAAALARTSSGDQAFGVRALITNDADAANDACGGGCGGVAWSGVFNLPNQAAQKDPAFIFAQNTFSNTLITAGTIAHEVGHTLGLAHDGVTTVPGDNYYGGHGNWIPIMGLGTNDKAMVQFSKGEYANANQGQDDLAIIAATGAPRRTDDVGNTTGTAKALVTDTTFRGTGVIGTASDVDVFRVTRTCTGAFNAVANTIGGGTSLDLSLEVLDSTGASLGFDNPASGQSFSGNYATPTGVNASESLGTRPPGTYYVRIDGVGSGNPLIDGYTDYGSVGQYSVAVTGCPATKPTAAKIGTASSGAKGGARNAVARWAGPSSTGGTPITGYKVIAYQLNSAGKVVKIRYSGLRSAGSRSYTWALPAGRYKFKVVAYNKIGAAPGSGFSRIVTSR